MGFKAKRSSQAKSDDSSSPSEKRRSTKLSLAFLVLMCGGAIPVLLEMWQKGMGLVADLSGRVVALEVAQSSSMHDVFFSGSPWLIYCKDTEPLDAEGKPEGSVSASLEAVASLAAKLGVADRFQVGMLDCSGSFSSGKNFYRRFDFTPEGHVVLFTVGNGGKPNLVPREYTQLIATWTSSAGKQYGPHNVNRLVELCRSRLHARYYSVTDSAQLKSACLDHKRCALTLAKGGLQNGSVTTLSYLATEFRLIKFAVVDTRKYFISLENRLPESSTQAPRLVYLRKASTADSAEGGKAPASVSHGARAHKGEFELTTIWTFLNSVFPLNISSTGVAPETRPEATNRLLPVRSAMYMRHRVKSDDGRPSRSSSAKQRSRSPKAPSAATRSQDANPAPASQPSTDKDREAAADRARYRRYQEQLAKQEADLDDVVTEGEVDAAAADNAEDDETAELLDD